jgi:hypothetical protein
MGSPRPRSVANESDATSSASRTVPGSAPGESCVTTCTIIYRDCPGKPACVARRHRGPGRGSRPRALPVIAGASSHADGGEHLHPDPGDARLRRNVGALHAPHRAPAELAARASRRHRLHTRVSVWVAQGVVRKRAAPFCVLQEPSSSGRIATNPARNGRDLWVRPGLSVHPEPVETAGENRCDIAVRVSDSEQARDSIATRSSWSSVVAAAFRIVLACVPYRKA